MEGEDLKAIMSSALKWMQKFYTGELVSFQKHGAAHLASIMPNLYQTELSSS